MASYERCPSGEPLFYGPGPRGWDAVVFNPIYDQAVVVGVASPDEALVVHVQRALAARDDPSLGQILSSGDERDRRAAWIWAAIETEAANLMDRLEIRFDEALLDALEMTSPELRDEALSGWVRAALERSPWTFWREALVAAAAGKAPYGAAQAFAKRHGIQLTQMPIFAETRDVAVARALQWFGLPCFP